MAEASGRSRRPPLWRRNGELFCRGQAFPRRWPACTHTAAAKKSHSTGCRKRQGLRAKEFRKENTIPEALAAPGKRSQTPPLAAAEVTGWSSRPGRKPGSRAGVVGGASVTRNNSQPAKAARSRRAGSWSLADRERCGRGQGAGPSPRPHSHHGGRGLSSGRGGKRQRAPAVAARQPKPGSRKLGAGSGGRGAALEEAQRGRLYLHQRNHRGAKGHCPPAVRINGGSTRQVMAAATAASTWRRNGELFCHSKAFPRRWPGFMRVIAIKKICVRKSMFLEPC